MPIQILNRKKLMIAKIQPIKLIGSTIQLEPLDSEHHAILKQLSQNEKISTYSPALRYKFDSWFNKALNIFPEHPQLSFVVRTLVDQKIIGSTRFYEINLAHRRLSIGYTWFVPEVWGTKINAECKLLLFRHAFDTLGMNRIEFSIDARNERSRAAVKKLGATEEGILRQHIVLDDGYVRDTVVYSILKTEWPRVFVMLNERLNQRG